jgi:hypothetical protein
MMGETVTGRMSWIDVSLVPKPYRHLSTLPFFGPYFILVSSAGRYCVVSDVVFASVRDHDRWACSWQPVRPG